LAHGDGGQTAQWLAGGTAGYQRFEFTSPSGEVAAPITYRLVPETCIEDAGGEFRELLGLLHYTCTQFFEQQSIRWNGRVYRYFVCWLRDHVHTLKGMKYFASDLNSAIDLYRESQREDGMIWDNLYHRTADPNYWDIRFHDGDYIRPFDDFTAEFKRIPVENDVEFLFVEGVYATWKANGDDGWMSQCLDACQRALNYSRTDRARWSSTYQLLKRGPTIDTWDFQHSDDCVVNGDAMRIDPDRTSFGVMFGDNTGYFAACRYLAEMLDGVGRTTEATTWRTLADEVQRRLTTLSWNGSFFTHWVPEDPARPRNLGVDPLIQVSLSNAYSLNRGLPDNQAQAIISTYRGLSQSLPPGSPGEWYTIYPPFGHGYGGHNGRWQYMNGGVTPIVAGELARGAFVHGQADYGVDILRRVAALSRQWGTTLQCTYTGAFEPQPEPVWRPLDLTSVANADTHAKAYPGAMPWTNEPGNDLAACPSGDYVAEGVPFRLLDRDSTEGRVAIGLSQAEGSPSRAEVPVGGIAASVWLLHTTSRTRAGGSVGSLVWHYEDGTSAAESVVEGVNVLRWWMPERPRGGGERRMAIGWAGENSSCPFVTLTLAGFSNPHPERSVRALEFEATRDGALWFILGASVSDQAGVLPASPISYGIPDNWGAAAVIYALVEGLAGVRDTGRAFDRAVIQPQWLTAGVNEAYVCIHYPASDGYVAYRYHQDAATGTTQLTVTGSGHDWTVNLNGQTHQVKGGVATVMMETKP